MDPQVLMDPYNQLIKGVKKVTKLRKKRRTWFAQTKVPLYITQRRESCQALNPPNQLRYQE